MNNLSIAVIAAGLLASSAVAAGSAPRGGWPAEAAQFQGLYQGAGSGSAGRDQSDFDRSGTRGRDGLGASPYHPEGPGNVTD